jgi:hypothetical protein
MLNKKDWKNIIKIVFGGLAVMFVASLFGLIIGLMIYEPTYPSVEVATTSTVATKT